MNSCVYQQAPTGLFCLVSPYVYACKEMRKNGCRKNASRQAFRQKGFSFSAGAKRNAHLYASAKQQLNTRDGEVESRQHEW